MAFFHPARSNEPFLRAPAVVLWLIASLFAVHLLQYVLRAETWQAILNTLTFYPARYSAEFLALHHAPSGTLVEQAVPFVGYMYLHAGFGHLVINSLWLLAFGPVVARRFGAFPFLLFFFVCGVAAIIVQLFCSWGSIAGIIGASGATSGLMAAAIRMLRMPGSYSFRDETPLAPLLSRPVISFTAIWMVLNLVAGLIGLGADAGPHLIAWQAHMGGYFAGLLLAGPFDSIARRGGSALA